MKGLLKDRLAGIQPQNFTSAEAKALTNLIYKESKSLAQEVRVYTKDIPELSFNMEMLSGVIEDFFFTRFAADVQAKYDERCQAKKEKFRSKLKIIEGYTISELMELLEIKTEFRLSDFNQPSVVPYKSAILELNNLGNMTNPNEMLVS